MAATDIERGLSTAEVEERIAAGKINRNMELKTKSVKELIIENLCTLFNLINVILAFLVILTGSFKNLTFLFVVFLNTAIGVIQSMRSKKMVDKLTLLTSKKAIAVRDGAEVELDLDQIVLDDIIRLGRGDQIPADAVVVSGEALVNESLLTGESDLIKKQPGSELMSGSFIDSDDALRGLCEGAAWLSSARAVRCPQIHILFHAAFQRKHQVVAHQLRLDRKSVV